MSKHATLKLALVAAACALTAGASPADPYPSLVTGVVTGSHAEAPAGWTAWSPDDPSSRRSGPLGTGGRLLADLGGLEGPLALLLEEADPEGGRAALVELDGHEPLTLLPPAELLPLPEASTASTSGGVLVTWQPVSGILAEHVIGHAVYRSDGARTVLVGATDAETTELLDLAIPTGEWSHVVRLQLAGGLETVPGAPSHPVAIFGRPDLDWDGIGDHRDNCRRFVNPEQVDTDGDGIGDACAFAWGDVSGDGLVDAGDVVRILRLAAGLDATTAELVRRANVAPATASGEALEPTLQEPWTVDVADVVLVLRASVGQVRFPPPS